MSRTKDLLHWERATKHVSIPPKWLRVTRSMKGTDPNTVPTGCVTAQSTSQGRFTMVHSHCRLTAWRTGCLTGPRE
jgi:hypothetical protein